MSATTASPEDTWGSLVTTALLGTDRRDPPPSPDGPIAELLGDLALIAGDSTPDTQFLDHVAAVTLARRAAVVPSRPAPLLEPPPQDDRPLCPTSAVAMWHRVVGEWPVLEDEWLSLAAAHRVALPGDLLVTLLGRHRRDAPRRARVAAIAGGVAQWLAEHVPAVAGHVSELTTTAPAEDGREANGGDPGALPPLPIPVELEPLLSADAATFAGTLRSYLETGQLDATHRRVLTHLIARCRTAVLDEAIDVISPLADHDAVAATAVDIARCRRDLLMSFDRPSTLRAVPR